MSAQDKKSSTSSASRYRVIPGGKFYFLYGENEVAMEQFKRDIVSANVDSQNRDENYAEIIPKAGAKLSSVMPDLLTELTTYSLIEDAQRVVTLYTCPDFFTSGDSSTVARKGKSAKTTKTTKSATKSTSDAVAKSPSASQHLAEFIEMELLPKLNAVLIIFVLEDGEKFRKASPSNPVMKIATKRNVAYEFKEQNVQWLFLDALFERRTADALSLWRQWYEVTGGAPKMYWLICANLRLLIQAKIATSDAVLSARDLTRQKLGDDYFPADAKTNLLKLTAAFRRQKLERCAAKFSLKHLLDCYEKLRDLMKYAIPLSSDVYVPDKALLSEYWIIEFSGDMSR
ncbi:hypothetical protein GX645_07010 [Candidatus Sumerlaeota bacterium]|nr:hypothetical protein [Candidatus Sumerlaeota bacterium]